MNGRRGCTAEPSWGCRSRVGGALRRGKTRKNSKKLEKSRLCVGICAPPTRDLQPHDGSAVQPRPSHRAQTPQILCSGLSGCRRTHAKSRFFRRSHQHVGSQRPSTSSTDRPDRFSRRRGARASAAEAMGAIGSGAGGPSRRGENRRFRALLAPVVGRCPATQPIALMGVPGLPRRVGVRRNQWRRSVEVLRPPDTKPPGPRGRGGTKFGRRSRHQNGSPRGCMRAPWTCPSAGEAMGHVR